MSASMEYKPSGAPGKAIYQPNMVATSPLTRDASPLRAVTEPSFSETVRRTNEKLQQIRDVEHVQLDGESLDIASVVAVSK